MEQSKDLKAIAEEVIKEKQQELISANKDYIKLFEQLSFFNDMGVCLVTQGFDYLDVSFADKVSWNILVTGTPHEYYVKSLEYCRPSTKCDSIEQLVRLISNYSVTKEFQKAAFESKCKYVSKDEY